MKRLIISFIVFSLMSSNSFAAGQSQKLEKIIVTPSRLPGAIGESSRSMTILGQPMLEITEYDAIPDQIAEVGGIDVRRRGVEGVQSDVSIRGTNFEQNTILIDGVKVNDPQTGHFNTDLPLTSLDVEKIDIIKGPASSVYGPNAFGGVINVVTKAPEDAYLKVRADAGSFDYFDTALSVSTPIKPLTNRFSIEERRSTGYMPETDFNIFTISDSARLDTSFGTYDFLFGYMYKDFGAADFYSNLYPNEHESTDTRFFKLGGQIEDGPLTMSPKLFLRRHWDKFALDANRPGWQTNYSTNYTYGMELNFAYENDFLDTAYGYELSRDTIDSTNLQTHSRTHDGIYLELSPHLLDELYLNIGLREDYFTGFGWQFSPSVSASYELFRNFKTRALIGRSYRIPTFTDLYYNDAANRGDSSLNSESSWSYEAGFDYSMSAFSASATYFYRYASDTIDWIRYSTRRSWQSSNIGTAKTNGVEVSLALSTEKIVPKLPLKKASLSYTGLDTYAKHDYLSKYALDYLKQQICATADLELFGFKNSWILNYKRRIGDSGYVVVDTKLSKDIVRKGRLGVEAFLEISNLFDVDYSEQSGVRMPGRWIRSGGRISF